jgi:hypothetical protein
MNHDEAAKLDEQIRDLADQAAQHLDYLADLLAEAKAGHIHEALDFPSWTAYLIDRLKPITKALSADDRRALAVELYVNGFSLRAVAEATGQSKSTVARQVSQSGTAQDTTGLDGKTYRHNGGRRGPLTPTDRLNRAEKLIRGIDFAGANADTATDICALIDRLRESIEPAGADAA